MMIRRNSEWKKAAQVLHFTAVLEKDYEKFAIIDPVVFPIELWGPLLWQRLCAKQP